jgi:hypothetical protein
MLDVSQHHTTEPGFLPEPENRIFFAVSKIIKIRFYQGFLIPNNKFDFSLQFLLKFMQSITFKFCFLLRNLDYLKDFSNILLFRPI